MRTMSKKLIAAVAIIGLALIVNSPAQAGKGMIVKKSAHGASETLDRLSKILESKGITVFARIDHAAGAKKIGVTMAPTQVLIFGNPKLGTPLMANTRTIGIDLPLKALAWEDDKGSWLAYNEPKHLAARHGTKVEKVIAKMTGALDKLTNAAIAK